MTADRNVVIADLPPEEFEREAQYAYAANRPKWAAMLRQAALVLAERDALREACKMAMAWHAGFPHSPDGTVSSPMMKTSGEVYESARAALGEGGGA